MTAKQLISIVSAARNEADNIPILYDKICEALKGRYWEWVVVDDHSDDESPSILEELSRKDKRVRHIRLARNHGSHLALLCGLNHSEGDCAAILAADLQDPPEIIPQMSALWQSGYDVVWLTRGLGREDSFSERVLAKLYYFFIRKIIGLQFIPATGADLVLIDRRVLDFVRKVEEPSVNILALIAWLGFKQTHISGLRRKRIHGKSKYTFSKKLQHVADTTFAFSVRPLRAISIVGIICGSAAFLYLINVIMAYIFADPVPGWASVAALVVFVGGIQLTILGIIGEYLAKMLTISHRRPLFVIESDSRCRPEQ